MLIAHDSQGQPVAGWDANRQDTYSCPECKAKVILKQGLVIVAHFAHQPAESCGYGEGESAIHMAMKHQLTRWWPDVELEVRGIVPHRRADAVLRSGGRPFVIECQASSISPEAWQARTRDYELAGVPLGWIWDISTLAQHHPPFEYRLLPAQLADAERKNDDLIVFRREPEALDRWRLTIPYRKDGYVRADVRRALKKRIAYADDQLPLPEPWGKRSLGKLWVEPPVPRELKHVLQDPTIQAAMDLLDGKVIEVRPVEEAP